MTLLTILAWTAPCLAASMLAGFLFANRTAILAWLFADGIEAAIYGWPDFPNAPDTLEHGVGDGSDGAGVTHFERGTNP